MNQNAPRGCAARGDEVYAGHTARARKCATSAHFIFYEISDCECNAAATSHGMAPKAALVIQNHEFAENTCMPLFMISVRSSLGRLEILSTSVSDGHRTATVEALLGHKI